MNLGEIEKRVAKLERDPGHSRLGRMTDDELERELQVSLDYLIAEYGSFGAVVAAMEASDEPEIREGARAAIAHSGARYGYTDPPAARQ